MYVNDDEIILRSGLQNHSSHPSALCFKYTWLAESLAMFNRILSKKMIPRDCLAKIIRKSEE